MEKRRRDFRGIPCPATVALTPPIFTQPTGGSERKTALGVALFLFAFSVLCGATLLRCAATFGALIYNV